MTEPHVHNWSILQLTFADGAPLAVFRDRQWQARDLVLLSNGITVVLMQCVGCGETKTVEMAGSPWELAAQLAAINARGLPG